MELSRTVQIGLEQNVNFIVPEILKAVSPKLLVHGRLAALIPDGTKRPWLPSLKRDATNNPVTLLEWERDKPGCDYGIRFWSRTIIVLDLERPGKGSDIGGIQILLNLEAEQREAIPRTGPKATSESGGEHWYFMIPVEYRGRLLNWNVFESIDIRVYIGLVVIPPSKGRSWITSF
jgi:hypothetical protein